MPQCNRCQDKTELEWYQDYQEKWHLGIKLDINSFRIHKCLTQEKTNQSIRFPDRKGWIKFICECGSEVRQNKKHFISFKSLLLCMDCKRQ